MQKKKWIFISEYCSGGSMRQKISDVESKNGSFEENQILAWLTSLISAVQHLNSFNIIHGFINPQNILFENRKSMEVKISDFGNSNFREMLIN